MVFFEETGGDLIKESVLLISSEGPFILDPAHVLVWCDLKLISDYSNDLCFLHSNGKQQRWISGLNKGW